MFNTLKAKTLELRKQRSHLAPTMQFHVAEISKIGKAKNREVTEDEVIQYLKKTVLKLKENEFADQEEIAVLEAMLPQMASRDQVRTHVFHLEATEGLDLSNKGAVMKAVKQEFGSLVDMKMVSEML
jgi:uncharacterized protein YqeY